MKKTLIFAASALLLAACTGEKGLVPEQINDDVKLVEYSFTVGVDTKASISDAGVFSWTANDKVAVWDAQNNTFDEFTAQQDGATTTITGMGLPDADYTKAFYPYAAAAGETSVVWPDSYASAADAAKGFPMMALNESGTLNFKHLGSLLKVTVSDLPSTVSSIVFNATGVSGTIAVDDTDPDNPFCAPGSTASSIAIPTDGAVSTSEGTVFYIPLPAGTLAGGFSIDFKLGTKVVGTKATTRDISVARGKLVPMKAFEPAFNWPGNPDAYDYGVAKGSTKTATYPSGERNTYGLTGDGKNTPTAKPFAVLDKVTYYPNLTFKNDKFQTGSVPGPSIWLEGYENVIPQNRCISWNVNRPGKFDYYASVYWTESNTTNLDRGFSYKVVLLKTVDGVTTAEVLYDVAFDSTTIDTSRQPWNHPEFYHEFEVTTDDLLGIDDAATIYLYHYNAKKLNVQIYHFPLKWTPSVAE